MGLSIEKSRSKTWKLDSELKELFLLSFNGDREAYRKFLIQVTILLKGYIHQNFNRHAYSQEIKEELVQDILLLIHRKRSSYRNDMPVTPWIYAVAKNYLIDQCRKKRIQLSDIKEIENISLDKNQDVIELNQQLDQLNEKQKLIFVLSKGYGYTAKEIKHKTGFSVSSIKVSIHRSLKLLRKGIR